MERTTETIMRDDGVVQIRNNGDTSMMEIIIFPGDGKVIRDSDGVRETLNCITTYYGSGMRPFKVNLKKVVLDRTTGIQSDVYYSFNLTYNNDGSVTTTDTYVENGGPYMKRTYEPENDSIPILYIDGVLCDAILVEEVEEIGIIN